VYISVYKAYHHPRVHTAKWQLYEVYMFTEFWKCGGGDDDDKDIGCSLTLITSSCIQICTTIYMDVKNKMVTVFS